MARRVSPAAEGRHSEIGVVKNAPRIARDKVLINAAGEGGVVGGGSGGDCETLSNTHFSTGRLASAEKDAREMS